MHIHPIRGLFTGTFLYKIIQEPEKKSQKNKVSKQQDFFSRDFLFQGLFSRGLILSAKMQNFISETFFTLILCDTLQEGILHLYSLTQAKNCDEKKHKNIFVWSPTDPTLQFEIHTIYIHCTAAYQIVYCSVLYCT